MQLILRGSLHTDKKAASTIRFRPVLDMFVELLPSAKIEVPNAKIGVVREIQSAPERGEQSGVNIIEHLRHC